MEKVTKFERDLSSGSVWKKLLAFSLPFVISNLIQSLYNVADMIIVGQFSGTVAMSGVNIGGQVTLLLTNLLVGLAAGASVLIAQYMGAKDRKALRETIGTLLTTLLIVSAVLTVVMVVFKAPVLRLIQTPPEAYSEAEDYLMITSLGIVFIAGYNALSAVMRGMGDSKRPLIFVGIACGVNIGLDLLLVGVFEMGAAGAALATVFSQALSMILCIIFLKSNDFVFDFKLPSFKIHPERIGMLLKVGAPMAVQNVTVSISFLLLTAMVNTLGVTASAAVGAVGKFNGFAIMPAIAMSASISSMSAQNIGAGEDGRAVKTMRAGMVMAVAMTAVVFVLVQLFPEPILRLFADDDAMVVAGVEYVRSFSFEYLVVPFVFSMNGLFIGSGHTTFSLINGCISSIFARVPVAYIFGIALKMGLFGVGLGAPVASAISCIVGMIYFLTGRWKKKVILKEPPIPSEV